MRPTEIDPERLYSFAEAARLLPSCAPGKTVHPDTLHGWRKDGLFSAHPRRVGRRRHWFVMGAELLRLMGFDAPPARAVGGGAEVESRVAAALARIEARRRG
jgi:hypothetical protein